MRRVAGIALSVLVAGALATPAAAAVAETELARAALEEGVAAAQDLAAATDEGTERARGLRRAAAALSAAAERKAERQGKGGRALGQGRAAEVHAYLLEGRSPSELPSHGKQVSALARAFEKLDRDRPGKGHGRDKQRADDLEDSGRVGVQPGHPADEDEAAEDEPGKGRHGKDEDRPSRGQARSAGGEDSDDESGEREDTGGDD